MSSLIPFTAYSEGQDETVIVEWRVHLVYERGGADIRYWSDSSWIKLDSCQTVTFDGDNPVELKNFGTGEGHIDIQRNINEHGWTKRDWARLGLHALVICRPNFWEQLDGRVVQGAYTYTDVLTWIGKNASALFPFGKLLFSIFGDDNKFGIESSPDTLAFQSYVDTLACTFRCELYNKNPSDIFTAYVRPRNEYSLYYLREIGDYAVIDSSGTVIETNVEPEQIPTLTQWGLIILVALFVFSTWVALKRRKAVVSRQ
jgi:hypothetical protein